MVKIGRNELCPCGSGKKYKKCCLDKLEQVSLANDYSQHLLDLWTYEEINGMSTMDII